MWSPLEYACHVRDVCRIFGVRATLMLTQTDPSFANWDQDATAVAERYFERVPADAWGRRGFRSNGSEFTVATLAVYFLHDIEHHLHDVAG